MSRFSPVSTARGCKVTRKSARKAATCCSYYLLDYTGLAKPLEWMRGCYGKRGAVTFHVCSSFLRTGNSLLLAFGTKGCIAGFELHLAQLQLVWVAPGFSWGWFQNNLAVPHGPAPLSHAGALWAALQGLLTARGGQWSPSTACNAWRCMPETQECQGCVVH